MPYAVPALLREELVLPRLCVGTTCRARFLGYTFVTLRIILEYGRHDATPGTTGGGIFDVIALLLTEVMDHALTPTACMLPGWKFAVDTTDLHDAQRYDHTPG